MNSVVVVCVLGEHGRVRNIVGALNGSDVDMFWQRTDPRARAG